MECYSRAGMHEQAYEALMFVWGQMLDRGATTFWEGFTDQVETNFHDALTTYTSYKSYRMSLCHAWSSTPVKWISETVMGITALEPGFKRIRFAPHAVGGMRHFSGSMHSPHGVIRVEWTLDDHGRMKAILEVPNEIDLEEKREGLELEIIRI